MIIFIAVCWAISTPLFGLAVYEQMVDSPDEQNPEQGEEQNASHL